MRLTTVIGVVLFCASLASGQQARIAEGIVEIPFSRLNENNPRDSQVRVIINGTPGTSPCTSGSERVFAIKLNGVWHCPRLSPGVGTGTVGGPPSTTVGELVVFGDSSGNIGRSNTLNGIPFLTSGIVSTLSSSGSGAVVRATSATLTTPSLLTPTIGSFSNAQHSHTDSNAGGQLNASNVFSAGIIPPARIISNALTANKCLRLSASGAIETAADDCGSGGGGGTPPGGVTGNLQVNNTGVFGGILNSSFNSITGTLTYSQQTNGNDTLLGFRATDTTPTGTWLRLRNSAATTDLFSVDVSGQIFTPALLMKTSAAPATPSAGNTIVWTDLTDKNLKAQDDTGQVTLTVRAMACSGTDKVSGISSAGIVTCTADQGGAGTGVITLNTLNTSDQTFVTVDDANIDLSISSSVSTHTFTVAWIGTLAKIRQHPETMYTGQSNTVTTGNQSFASALTLTVPTDAGANPTTSAQIAYDSTSNTWEAGVNGANRTFAFLTGSQTFTDKTLDNSTTINVRDTLLTLQDNADPTKTANFELSGITSGQNRVVTIANAASVTVQPSTLTTNQVVTHIDSSGVQQKTQLSFANLSGTMGETQGGTGQTAYAQGDILYASSANVLSRLPKSTIATRYLCNTGASNNPAWCQVDLTNGVTGALPFASLSGSATDAQIPNTITIDLATVATTANAGDSATAFFSAGTIEAARLPDLSGLTGAVTDAQVPNTITIDLATVAATANAGDSATAFFSSGTIEAARLGSGSGGAVKFLREDQTWQVPAGAGDMLLASAQTNTGAKTFAAATLIVGSAASATPVAGAFYEDTDDEKLYWAPNGSTWGEVFVSGLSVVNLASANVTGDLPYANLTASTAASKLLGRGDSGAGDWQEITIGSGLTMTGTTLSSSGGAGTINSGATNAIPKYTASTTIDDSLLSDDGTTLAYSGAGGLSLTGSGAGYIELAEGTAPAVVANRITLTAPADVPAGGLLYILPSDTPTNGEQLTANISGTTVTLSWDAAGAGGSGDSVSVNGSATTDANFINTAASGTVASVTFSLDTGATPDAVSLVIGTASLTEAGIITTGTQGLAGIKVLGHTTALGRLAQSLEITTSANFGGAAFNTFSTNAVEASLLDFNRSKSATKGTMTVVAADDLLGALSFRGADGTDFEYGAQITGSVDGTPGNNDMPGRLSFFTTSDGAVDLTERWRITSAGHFLAGADNAYDVGAAGSFRPRNVNVATAVLTPQVTWTTSVFDTFGSGTPEGAVTAAVGSVYRRTNGSASTTLYVKESGSGNTGWVAVGAGGGSGTINSGTTNNISKYVGATTLDDSLLSDDATTLTYSGSGGFSLTATGGGYLQLTEGTPPSIVANTVQHAVSADAPAGGTQYLWGAAAGSGILRVTNSTGVMTVTQDAGISHLASSTSADLRGALSDETGTGAAVFVAGNIGAGTATTASVNDSSTLIATTAYVQSELTAYAADTVTFTNKTIDVEGTGNVFTSSHKVFLPAAGCQNTSAASFFDLPTTTPAVAACVTGTNTQKGVLDFADTSGGFSAQTTLALPVDFTGTIDARIYWTTTATSGNVEWSLSTICTATDATETDDPAFNAASTVVTAAPGVANRVQTSSITSVTITGCAANELLHVRLFRDGNDAQDTLSATVRLVGLELTVRRAQ